MVMLGDVLWGNGICPEIESSCSTDGADGSDELLFFLLEACEAPVSFDGWDVSCKLSSASGCCSDSIEGGGGAAQGLLAMVG
jgi:hypothetical protein